MPKYVTKYKKQFAGMAEAYIISKKDTYVNGKLKINLPTIGDFAINFLHVTKMTVYNWEKDYPKFRKALDRIKQEQKQRLMEEGLAGNYNAALAKLILSNNHGMRERADITTDDEPLNTFTDEQASKIAERIARGKKINDNQSGS